MAKNNRCPLQEECEKKCTWQHHELDCPYYSVNARKDYYIEDQEEIRRKRDRETEEEMWARYLAEREDDEKENYEPEKWEDKPTPEITYLDGPDGVTEKIKKAMYDAAKQFVYIGFLLWETQEYGYYKEHGYQSVYEYAEAELGFKKSSTKNFIAINYEFGYRKINDGWERADHRTMSLQPKYQDFNYSQLCEMLAMTPAKRETITPDMTIKQIREIKKQPEPDLPPNMETIPIPMPEDKPTGQTSGQKNQFIKIEPCPFCGGKAVIERRTDTIGHGDYVKETFIMCTKCHATGPIFDDYYGSTERENTEKAIKGWNTRIQKK